MDGVYPTGVQGMEKFFSVHLCNNVCQKLGIADPAKMKKGRDMATGVGGCPVPGRQRAARPGLRPKRASRSEPGHE